MIERRPILDLISHLVLIIGVVIVAFPMYVAFVASTQTAEQAAAAPLSLIPGDQFIANYSAVIIKGASGNVSVPPVAHMMWVSLVSALAIAIGKITISMLSAFAIVYFRFPGRSLFFWMIFLTLMLPVEVRITPTYQVVSDLGMLNSYAGLTIPLIASATATFLFRQFFLTVPEELAEAARIDGAGPMRFFKDVLWPLSRTNVIALFVIMFIYGWNQYLWPLLIATEQSMYPVGIGIRTMISGGDAAVDWNLVMATLILAMLPPGLVVVIMQRWFVKGLVDSEK
ncbi:MAG TPA: sn-glycerol-3-phosphate ABC transporter permease UgpE [Noviherbaspirillum sp.]|jgi:sn-glycerol 3-phosphate transport system permease protein|uniref:sn-glycerol-3-phosphate ABC transporter permease UgpE n=1 Tax=Noviherbaspirillum sp. TaxID=1926288 RepID=UPI002DDD8205|nr:sn-glycerol-3-phosphate ABC transporter permease UgpE [Noviherbaspirillum sp.]HEV2610476.1 sn-glycerol-3-phosphate ABC transporter permease UgpE [Noviherbaspirillum sp.]